MIPPSLAQFIFWLAAAGCLIAHAAILRSVLRVRRGSPGGSEVSPSPREVVWAVLPAIGLAVVLVFTWSRVVT